MPLGQLVLIVLAVLATSGHGRSMLLQFRLSGGVAAVILAASALGIALTWVVPLVPPVVIDAGSATLIGAVVAVGVRSARATDALRGRSFPLAVLVTALFVLVLHGYVPQEPGAVLDARTALLFAAGLIAAGIARSPAIACSAAAIAYVAVLARDWVIMHRSGYTMVPLPVGGYGLDMLVLSLMMATLASVLMAAMSDGKHGQMNTGAEPVRKGGGTA